MQQCRWPDARKLTGVLVAVILVLSVGAASVSVAINPGHNPLTALGYETYADLNEADLDKVRFCDTTMPDRTKNNDGCRAAWPGPARLTHGRRR